MCQGYGVGLAGAACCVSRAHGLIALVLVLALVLAVCVMHAHMCRIFGFRAYF